MRALQDWDQSDLQRLIDDGIPESLELDYKASPALAKTPLAVTEISKDVSAFANSAGGRLIYGVIERDNLPVALDDGSDARTITREWLEQIINSRIQPRISGVVIKPIPLASGGNAYVVDIPQAKVHAPHQADNHRYYRRFNFQSVPMEDYEVKDAMRRSVSSQPFLSLVWQPIENEAGELDKCRMIFSGGNLAVEPVMYGLIRIIMDRRLIPQDASYPEWTINREVVTADGGLELVLIQRNVSVPHHLPFFEGVNWSILTAVVPKPEDGVYPISYSFQCPGAAKTFAGTFRFENGAIFPHSEESGELLA